jgi:uncharacterized membrane protein
LTRDPVGCTEGLWILEIKILVWHLIIIIKTIVFTIFFQFIQLINTGNNSFTNQNITYNDSHGLESFWRTIYSSM